MRPEAERGRERRGRDPAKLRHDSRVALVEARQIEGQLRALMAGHSLVEDRLARQVARKLLDTLDNYERLRVLARETGVQL